MEQDFLANIFSVREDTKEKNDEDIEEERNHEMETSRGTGREFAKTKASENKETVSLDDKKSFHGNGDEKKLVQKKEPKFQILENLIQQSFENDAYVANDENNLGFEDGNISKAFLENLSSQDSKLGHISEAGHENSSSLVQHGHYLAIPMGQASTTKYNIR